MLYAAAWVERNFWAEPALLKRCILRSARLLKAFPKGFALDPSHQPHVTMLQQFVRTADLDNVTAAANAVMSKERPASWTLKTIKYYYIPSPPLGLAGIVVEPTEDLHRLQNELIAAVAPYAAKTGTPASFFSDEGGRVRHRHELERTPLFRAEGGQERHVQERKKRHAKTELNARYWRVANPGCVRNSNARTFASACAKIRDPTPAASRDKLKPSRKSDDEMG